MDIMINDFMSNDHDRLDKIFLNFARNRKNKSVKSKGLFIQFKKGLENHIGWEEEILFPLFENQTKMSGAGPTKVMRIEHKEIKKYLNEILKKITKNNYETNKAEKKLIEILSDHNNKEEMILYPWIDNSISKAVRIKSLTQMKKSLK